MFAVLLLLLLLLLLLSACSQSVPSCSHQGDARQHWLGGCMCREDSWPELQGQLLDQGVW
jgi:hypothetical protein